MVLSSDTDAPQPKLTHTAESIKGPKVDNLGLFYLCTKIKIWFHFVFFFQEKAFYRTVLDCIFKDSTLKSNFRYILEIRHLNR